VKQTQTINALMKASSMIEQLTSILYDKEFANQMLENWKPILDKAICEIEKNAKETTRRMQ
tara:strand:+ start:1138 stop:1320 length:183 start_codon:yes stop_codon:yes gene_type:complete